jgi:GTP-binding protein
MIDQAILKVSAGKGGNGSISGRHEKFVPYGGPDGGDGGDGGSVIVRCDGNVSTLLDFRYRTEFSAGNGGQGAGSQKHGKKGADVEIVVPEGTELWSGGKEPWRMADLQASGDWLVVAKGGRGGRGNSRFASPTNRFPLLAEAGDPGEGLTLTLELKLLADVGIIGAPNVGKSSLLAAVSGARPKIAEYPFTTLEPVLGVVEHRGASFVMVDIPGLIEGAHMGIGLGQEFLRHIERTRVLVHLVDGSIEDPVGQYRQVRDELTLFDERLVSKPEIIVVNKSDIPGVDERYERLKEDMSPHEAPTHCISAAGRKGLSQLLDGVRMALDSVPQTGKVPERGEAVPVLRPRGVDKPQMVRKQGRKYVVSLRAAIRLATMVDGQDWEAKTQMYAQLGRLGVIAALEKSGIAQGEVFQVAKLEWEWQ